MYIIGYASCFFSDIINYVRPTYGKLVGTYPLIRCLGSLIPLKTVLSQSGMFLSFIFILDLVCEPAHFPSINNVETFKKHFQDCSSTGSAVNHLYPARHSELKTCYIQDEKMLFSCAGEHETLQRLCPCRTFIKHQSALCQSCL